MVRADENLAFKLCDVLVEQGDGGACDDGAA
jgi:hypothetical protein